MPNSRPSERGPTIILIHSPLVGPFTWQLVATVLRDRGYEVSVPSLSLANGLPYFASLATQITSEAREEHAGPVFFVAHSGAGAIIPSVIETSPANTKAALFVDAILPNPGMSWLDNAPTSLREYLINQARDGLLPRWSDWFPPATLVSLLPDPSMREHFIDELRSLPMDYFEEREPHSTQWPIARCGYLQLSAAYEAEAQAARSRSWIVRREDSNHLAMITAPETVATAVLSMLDEILCRAIGDNAP